MDQKLSRGDAVALLALFLLALVFLRDIQQFSSVPPFDATRVEMGVLHPVERAPAHPIWTLHRTPPSGRVTRYPRVWSHVRVLDTTPQGALWERSGPAQLVRDEAGVLRIIEDSS